MEGPASDLAKHLRVATRTYGHHRIELEWRLGHRQGNFRPGVDPSAWERLRAALDASPAFQKSFARSTERLEDRGGIKCIESEGQSTWMHKKRLANVDCDPPGPWTIRASVSLEEPQDTGPPGSTMKYERRKQRWSYRHRCWRIDLTRVATNLPANADDDVDAHEVEIELADPGVLFERPFDHVAAWGWKMAEEVCGLMAAAR